MTAEVGVVIVSWQVRALLARCLESLAASAWPLRVVVVDNASTDGTLAQLRPRFPEHTWQANPDNAGFTRANNQGFRLLGLTGIQGGAPAVPAAGLAPPPYTLILNPDTELAPDAIARLVAVLEAHPEAGAVGPALHYPDGSPQPSRRRFPSPWVGLVESTPIGWHLPGLPAIRRFHMADAPEEAGEVDWLTGAAILFRSAALEAVGGFDEGFFMYSEELDLCRRLHRAGWRLRYEPAARVLHHEGKSSEQVVPRRHRMFQRSRVRYFYKHHGRAAGALLRWGILAQFAFEAGLEGLKWLAGHKRPLRRARVAAYASVLRDGLAPGALGPGPSPDPGPDARQARPEA